jgi:hypothetical protein
LRGGEKKKNEKESRVGQPRKWAKPRFILSKLFFVHDLILGSNVF